MSGLAVYQQTRAQNLDDLVTRYAPLVKRIAFHLISRLPPSVQADDLIQAGMIGLLEAARKYDAEQGASFETYAGIRIRGSMLDEVRKGDWAPRSLHRKAREVSEAIREIECEKGREARDPEVAQRMGIPLDTYHRILQDTAEHKVFSVEDFSDGGESFSTGMGGTINGPLDDLEFLDFKKTLARVIGGLPEREQLVVSLYYDEELNLKEIGAVLEVSESRVCQILSQSLLRLRSRMEEWRDGL